MFFHEEFMLISHFLFFCLELKIGDSERKSLLPLFSLWEEWKFHAFGIMEIHMKNTHFKNHLRFSKPVENQLYVNSI